MTTDRTGPVLDVERLDAAADEALTGVRLDLDAVRARVAVEAGRNRARRWALAAVAAVVVLLAAVTASGLGVLRSTPQPATPVTGPGALPQAVHPVPRLVASVTDEPIGRVALVLAAPVDVVGLRTYSGVGPVLVAADGGAYRRLPVTDDVGAVSVSADGRVVAWADAADGEANPEVGALDGTVRWVHVGTGRAASAGFGYPASVVPGVERTLLSPDGGRVLTWVTRRTDPSDPGLRTTDLWSVDTSSGAVTSLCRVCDPSAAFDASGRLLAEAVEASPVGDALLPSAGSFWAPTSDYFMSPAVLVSPDGSRRLVVDKDQPQELGPADPFRLVEVDTTGRAVSTTPLGTQLGVTLLAWDDRTAWVSVRQQGWASEVVRRVTLGGSWTEVLARTGAGGSAFDPSTGPGLPAVAAVTADVAAGGRTVATPPPAGRPWWSPASVWLYASHYPLVPGLLVGLVVVVLLRRLRRSPRPWRSVPPPSRIARAADEAAQDMGGPR